ncbi:hypothetical protein GUJ93_ZPchr0011g27097 [Zizania palustris]|uniref:Uncharacterized protein n=1 Tax=Zizania palustris TaxID=103762 RepID=A0A8J5WM15_ZIZPA|nr:hypothetical protein GUJ93_ZPchr0011g27097 [Zizania palustris]
MVDTSSITNLKALARPSHTLFFYKQGAPVHTARESRCVARVRAVEVGGRGRQRWFYTQPGALKWVAVTTSVTVEAYHITRPMLWRRTGRRTTCLPRLHASMSPTSASSATITVHLFHAC